MYISIAECAALLGVNPKTVRRLVRAGQLPALQVGGVLRVNRDDLSELSYSPAKVDERTARPPRRPREPKGEFTRRVRADEHSPTTEKGPG